MGYASARYQRTHAELKRVRGEANEHTCLCGKPALGWGTTGSTPDTPRERNWHDRTPE